MLFSNQSTKQSPNTYQMDNIMLNKRDGKWQQTVKL